MPPQLTILHDDSELAVLNGEQPRYTIGRGDDNDIVSGNKR